MLVKDLAKYIDKRRGVLHVGGCIGEECDWYDKVNFERVVWFEPCKLSFNLLKEHTSKYGNQVAIHLGIHDTLKSATLHVASNWGQSSSILDFGVHEKYYPKIHYVRDEEIQLMRMDEWFKINGFTIRDFNFLNVDVQGVELNVMKSFGDDIRRLDYIYTEVNDQYLYKDCSLLVDIDHYLFQYKFKRVVLKMTQYHWGDALYVKR